MQFARRFYLAQWYRECSLAIHKSSAETASSVSETSSSDVTQRKMKKRKGKKNRRQSEEDGDENDETTTASAGGSTTNTVQTELEQTQKWLLTQMQTGLASAAASRFVLHKSSNKIRWRRLTAELTSPTVVWLTGLVVSALRIRARGYEFESQVAPLFHWVATLGKLFTHIASPVSQLQEAGVQKEVFGAEVVMVIMCARLS